MNLSKGDIYFYCKQCRFYSHNAIESIMHMYINHDYPMPIFSYGMLITAGMLFKKLNEDKIKLEDQSSVTSTVTT